MWNFHGHLDGYELGDSLEFEVYDKDMLMRDSLLGRATLSCDEFLTLGFDGQLPLVDAGKGVQACEGLVENVASIIGHAMAAFPQDTPLGMGTLEQRSRA